MPSRLVMPSLNTTAAKLAVALVATSVVSRLLEAWAGFTLRLVPFEVRKLALWQLVSWCLIETSPWAIIFGALLLVSFGGYLEQVWGRWKLLRFGFGVTFVVGLLTVALSFAIPSLQAFRFGGGGVMTSALMVTFGLTLGPRPANFFFFSMNGYQLAAFAGGMTLLNALFFAWQAVVPDALGIALSAGLWHFGGPSDWWERFGSWRLRRQLKARAKHLEVLDPNRNVRDGSDKYLH